MDDLFGFEEKADEIAKKKRQERRKKLNKTKSIEMAENILYRNYNNKEHE